MTRSIGIYMYPEVEVLDFAGPYEVFNTASRVHSRTHPDRPMPFLVRLIAANSGVVEARGGLRIHPDHSMADHPPIDILIIPGGVVEQELDRKGLSDWIHSVDRSAEIMASVCTGAFILANAGLLEHLSATTHWEDIEDLSRRYPNIRPVDKKRWVEEGRIITAAGISAGLDVSLHIVAKLEGRELAELTARQMDYRWQANP